MSIKLRDYQVELIDQTRELMKKGYKRILLQSPTGSGKTMLTASMFKTSASKGISSWFIVHRRELVKQSIKAFYEVEIPHGIIASGFQGNTKKLVQIASIGTLIRRIKNAGEPKMIVLDECHHAVAGSWKKLFEAFPNAYFIGLTATPQRLDGKGLGDLFQVMVNGKSVRWLIDNNFLSPYKMFVPGSPSLLGVHTKMGDYDKKELAEKLDKPTITGDAITHYKKFSNGKRAVVFCVSIAHSKHVTDQFKANGIEAEHVDGETPTDLRDKTIKRFERGEIKVLSNVDLFGEGFDLPALEAVILLRPTQSLGLYLQQVGRALRIHPGKKEAIILDHAGNVMTHGLPDDEREWSLDGAMRGGQKKLDNEASVRICPKCFAVQFPTRKECSFCGEIFEIKSREIEEVAGELVELDPETIRQQRRERMAKQARCETLDELKEYAKKMGYKQGWAKYIFNARQQKRNGAMAS